MPERKGLVINSDYLLTPSNEISFVITAGKREEGKIFVPLTGEQFNALEAYQKSSREGFCKVVLSHGKKLIEWKSFFPLGAIDTREMEKKHEARAAPRRLGIGSLAHYAITEYLCRKHGLQDYQIKHEPSASDERIRHLRSMGIDYSRTYSFPVYRDIVRLAVI